MVLGRKVCVRFRRTDFRHPSALTNHLGRCRATLSLRIRYRCVSSRSGTGRFLPSTEPALGYSCSRKRLVQAKWVESPWIPDGDGAGMFAPALDGPTFVIGPHLLSAVAEQHGTRELGIRYRYVSSSCGTGRFIQWIEPEYWVVERANRLRRRKRGVRGTLSNRDGTGRFLPKYGTQVMGRRACQVGAASVVAYKTREVIPILVIYHVGPAIRLGNNWPK